MQTAKDGQEKPSGAIMQSVQVLYNKRAGMSEMSQITTKESTL